VDFTPFLLRTRCGTQALCGGRLPNIGGAPDECCRGNREIVTLVQFGDRKNNVPFSATTRPKYTKHDSYGEKKTWANMFGLVF